MITINNFKEVLTILKFEKQDKLYSKYFDNVDTFLKVDFENNQLIYPEDKGLIINMRTTGNFSQSENFVVFECVNRLFEQGYKPEHIELEPQWKSGHGASGGRADILIKDNSDKPLLIIECKTAGKEFEEAWEKTKLDGGQILTYADRERTTQFVCLYASDLVDNQIEYKNYIITITDIKNLVQQYEGKQEKPLFYQNITDVKQWHKVWKDTYNFDVKTKGIFEKDIQAYNIGKQKININDLVKVGRNDIQPKYHEFATILRKYNVSGRENAFDKLVNLFLCKIVDEKQNPHELEFYWKGEYFDDYFSLIDRLQRLYKEGMQEFLKEKVTYIDDKKIKEAFKYFVNDPDATQEKILEYFREQKYFTNNDFSFVDVHNDKLFYQNADVLLQIIRMLQDIQLNGDQQNQFLGDLFEGFLDSGVKQSEGQFFTPLPITKFILMSLPLENLVQQHEKAIKTIDYACGAGHFLTEYAAQIKPFVQRHKNIDIKSYYKNIYGIEKEYRLSKVAKVSAFMYSQDEINILYGDALDSNTLTKLELFEKFNVLVANPPFSVKGFLETLSEKEREQYSLFKEIDPKSISKNNAIETFFIERMQQIVAPKGVVGIIVPSSVLSKSGVYTKTRELLLQYFDVVSLVELGSKTFGRTGTTTIILFLRRKDDNPEPAKQYWFRVNHWFNKNKNEYNEKIEFIFQDKHFVERYCTYVGIPFEDYETLCQGQPSDKLLNLTILQDYFAEFNKLNEVKKIKESHQKDLVNLPKNLISSLKKEQKEIKTTFTDKELEQQAQSLLPQKRQELLDSQQVELNRRFVIYAQGIEKDKLYYFILASINPQEVLIVRSPADSKQQKLFLGYEWSAKKGKEGIKYLAAAIKIEKTDDDVDSDDDDERVLKNILSRDNIQTPMYDHNDRYNADKINYYIQQNFLNAPLSIPEDLKPFVALSKLEDLLDFSQKEFSKTISLASKKVFTIESQWELVRLGEIAEIQSGGTPSSDIKEYWDGTINWATLVDTKQKYLYTTQRKITAAGLKNSSAKLLPINTVIFSSRATIGDVTIAKVETATNQGYKNFICDESKVNYTFLYEILTYYAADIAALAGGMTFKEISKTVISNFKIPLPPLSIQQQIVDELEQFEQNKNQLLKDGISLKNFEKLVKETKNKILEKYI